MAGLSRQGMMALDVRNMPVMGWQEQGWRLATPVVPASAGTHNDRALLFSESVYQFVLP